MVIASHMSTASLLMLTVERNPAMKNACVEPHPMNFTELCQECRSINTHEIKSWSISALLQKAVGYQMLCCKNCGHRWKAFLPMQFTLNLVYLLLAGEVIFLMASYFRDLVHYLT